MAAPETPDVTLRTRAQRRARLHGIYLIVNEGEPHPVTIATAAIDAGVRIVQYRAKSGLVAGHVRELRALSKARGALLIVNDDAHAAIAFDCDGVHLGPGDAGFLDVSAVRTAFPDGIIGLSCGTIAETLRANQQDVDYFGVGSVFATVSKSDAGAPIGLDGLERIARVSGRPVAAIGGIDATNVRAVARTGVAMAAVISAISGDRDAGTAARRLVRAWSEHGAP